jgi:hypothetical protein
MTRTMKFMERVGAEKRGRTREARRERGNPMDFVPEGANGIEILTSGKGSEVNSRL